jgi:hypothetical protein
MSQNVSCCLNTDIAAVTDFNTAGSAKSFLQRIGALDATQVGSRIQPDAWKVHSIPLVSPSLLPELQFPFAGEQPPDQGQTLEWPFPDLKRASAEG